MCICRCCDFISFVFFVELLTFTVIDLYRFFEEAVLHIYWCPLLSAAVLESVPFIDTDKY